MDTKPRTATPKVIVDPSCREEEASAGLLRLPTTARAEGTPKPAAAPRREDPERTRIRSTGKTPRPRPLALQTCEACGAEVTELRRGRCWGCYTRWIESRPVGFGAYCPVCGERRRANLRMVELHGCWQSFCHNCAANVLALSPIPTDIEEIRRRVGRDRRASERRGGRRTDTRVFPRERRGLERRTVGRAVGDDLLLIEDDGIIIIEQPPETSAETRIVSHVLTEQSEPVRTAAAPRRGEPE
jgi:hypothetical protein